MTNESRIGRLSASGVSSREERYWKIVLIIDDGPDVATAFKLGIENTNKRIVVDAFSDPRKALSNFLPNFYDLLLVDINMPCMNGFQLSERILDIDINVKICYMSSGEINCNALGEIYPAISLGCFIKKPVTIDYLIDRISKELG